MAIRKLTPPAPIHPAVHDRRVPAEMGRRRKPRYGLRDHWAAIEVGCLGLTVETRAEGGCAAGDIRCEIRDISSAAVKVLAPYIARPDMLDIASSNFWVRLHLGGTEHRLMAGVARWKYIDDQRVEIVLDFLLSGPSAAEISKASRG